MVKCDFCDENFSKRQDLLTHKHQKHSELPDTTFRCGHCPTNFTLAKNLVRHLKNIHKCNRSVRCTSCQTFFGLEEDWQNHCSAEHSVVASTRRTNPSEIQQSHEFVLERERKAVREHFQSFRLKMTNDTSFDPFEFLVNNETAIEEFVSKKLETMITIKFGICIEVSFVKPLTDDSTVCYFHSPMESLSTTLTADEYYSHVDKLLSKMNVFCTAGSGWVIEKLNLVELKISKFAPLWAGSYIASPPELENQRKSILNIRNWKDNLCFLYSVLAALFPVKQNQDRPQSYRQHLSRLFYNPRKMPIALADIPTFEKNNHLKINVFAYEQKKIYPVYLTKYKNSAKRINLLLLSEENNWHYCLIKNLDRVMKVLLRSPATARSKNNIRKFCERCLQSIAREKIKLHKSLCEHHQPQVIEMPKDGSTVKFKNWQKTFKCPFVVYADLEALDVRTDSFESVEKLIENGLNNGRASSCVIENQYPCSFGVVLVDSRNSEVRMEKFYRGEDCIAVLMDTLRSWVKWTESERQRFRFLKLSNSKKRELIEHWANPCCICQKCFEMDDDKVIHHCHLTGTVFGVAHNACNLKVAVGSFLPVFFHNLSRYDAHHIVKYLKLKDNEILSAISRTEETFISFSVQVPICSYINKCGVERIVRNEIRFLDSFNFMASGLDSLAQTLQDDDLKLLRHHFQSYSNSDFRKIRSKGLFPYSYLNCFEKFDEIGLPPFGDDWRNTLTGKIDITEEMYRKAVDMYHLFKCNSFGDYHDAYLQTDVFLLADVFELFRSVCIKVYRLDPAYFYSAPNLSWDAMLVTTEVELGLLSDVDMLLFCEKAIRGRLNGVGALRHFRANNKDLHNYNKNEK